MPFLYRTIIAVFFICLSLAVKAGQSNDVLVLQNLEHELNQQPWKTYEKIQSQAGKYADSTLNYKLWWLLRKAQAEDLLDLVDEFQLTVEMAQLLINEKAEAKIAINFNIFYGIILQRQGKYQAAQSVLQKAQQVAISHKYTFLAVSAKYELAYTRNLIELYEYSLTDLQQAYVEAFASNDALLIAKINEVYGAIYGYLHDYSQSIDYYQKALISYQQLAYPAHEAEAIYGLAVAYRYWEKYDLALVYYERYLKTIEGYPNSTDAQFYALYGISMTLAGKGDCPQALSYIDKSLNLNGLIDFKAELYKRQTLCFIEQNKLNLATAALDKAINIFADFPELAGTRWQIEVIKISAQLSQAVGDFEQAYRLLEKYNQSEVTLLKKNSSDRLLRVKSALKVERQNVEISLLKQRAKVHNLQLTQQKQENKIKTYIMICIVMLIVFGLIFIYFQWRHNEKLKALSIRDPLLDLYNRRYVFYFLDKLISGIHLEKSQISIILIDIDDFKQVNDLYGHSFGDDVISEIGQIGKDTIRVEDVIGRVGSEEFLCVLPRIDNIQCLHIAQRLVKKVHGHAFFVSDTEENKKPVIITVSIGITTTSVDTVNSSDLYAQAEKALTHAKARGKNRAVQYQHTM